METYLTLQTIMIDSQKKFIIIIIIIIIID